MTFADSPVEALVQVHTTTNNNSITTNRAISVLTAPNAYVDSKNYIVVDYTVG
jgi:hypothetical protein